MTNSHELQALANCGGIVTLPRATYHIDYPVVVPSGTVIDGSGSFITTELSNRHTFLVRDCENVCIRNLNIRGNWSASSGDAASIGAAIQIERSSTVLIENIEISNTLGRGIVATSRTYDLTIRDCYIRNCSISIFLFKGIKHGFIESNRIFDSRIMGLYVDDATEGDTEETAIPNHLTIIRGNMIEGGGTSPRNTGVGIAVSGSTDTIISNNIVGSFGTMDRISHGIILNNGQGGYNQGRRTVVCGNIIYGHTGYGLYSVGQENLVEYGNVYSGNGLGDVKLVGAEV